MFNKMLVQKALKRSRIFGDNAELLVNDPVYGQSSVISQLIYDIFGGEILKTHNSNGWHFYNRINGKIIDFTKPDMGESYRFTELDHLISSPDETYNYFKKIEYTQYFVDFLRTFEKTAGNKMFLSSTKYFSA